MASPKKARGFTLVELLVVITIIGMLMSLLLPAIQSAREAGRRSVCSSNMRNLAVALANFEGSKKGFPGYANIVNNKRASYIVPLLPFLDRNDIYQQWQNLTPPNAAVTTQMYVSGTLNNPWSFTNMNILVCPSNPTQDVNGNPLSFIVNTGSALTANDFYPLATATWIEDINSGVFFNQCGADGLSSAIVNRNPISALTPTNPVFGTIFKKPTMDFIGTNDGTSMTLMLSENLQATNWATDPLDTANAVQLPFQNDFQLRQQTGFVWYITGNQNNAEPAPGNTNFYPLSMKINAQSKNFTGSIALQYNSSPPAGIPFPQGGLAASRPSAQHPGGVNTIFCDSHLRFISEDIQYHVYTQLMTPRGKAVVVAVGNPNKTATTTATPWNYILNETDY